MKFFDHISDGWTFVGLLGLFLFGVFACIHGCRQEQIQAKWPSTQGFITSWHEKDVTIPKKNFKRNVHETHLELLYEYQVGDSFFTGRAYRNCSASSAWHPGGSRQMINSDSDRIPVRVYYDPLHPHTSVLERAKFTFDWYLWPFFIGTALGICIYAYDLFFKKPK